jgi:hypothetical protein
MTSTLIEAVPCMLVEMNRCDMSHIASHQHATLYMFDGQLIMLVNTAALAAVIPQWLITGPSVNATIPMDNSVGEQTPILASDNTDYPIPRDRYGDPITYDSNPACLAGVMHDINKWIERTGNYKLLFYEQYSGPRQYPCRRPATSSWSVCPIR